MGYGILHGGGRTLDYVAAGVITAKGSWPLWRRLVELANGLEEAIAEVDPNEVVLCGIEAGFVKGQMGALVSGAARGVAMVTLGKRFNVEVKQYAPASVKLAASGHGSMEKAGLARIVQARLRMNVLPVSDAADALAVAITRACDSALYLASID